MTSTREPHAREWFAAAALRVCHEYRTLAQYKSEHRNVELLRDTLEIDLCGKLAAFFGTASSIFAQGKKGIDLRVRVPRLEAEVKFLLARNSYSAVMKDWSALLKFPNSNEKFSRWAWIVFFPCTDWLSFPECQTVRKPAATAYNWSDVAPFLPVAEPFMPPGGTKQKLRWRSHPNRRTVLWLPQGKKVQVDLVGCASDCLWAAVYTRITPNEYKELKTFTEIKVADAGIARLNRQFK